MSDCLDITIETLVNANGDWVLTYTWNRYGNNVMFLLPNMQEEDDEQVINEEVMDSITSCFEEAHLIEQFLEEFPYTPFIVKGTSTSNCITTMNDRLKRYKGNMNKFMDDFKEFDAWRRVIHEVAIGPDSIMYDAYYNGWRTIQT